MENAVLLPLSGLCLGIALAGVVSEIAGDRSRREQLFLIAIYVAFCILAALPIIRLIGDSAVMFYLPLMLVALLALPPAIYHYVLAKTGSDAVGLIRSRHLVLPSIGFATCLGFWVLPSDIKQTLFIDGDLPAQTFPTVLVLMTFALLMLWLAASGIYLFSTLKRLRVYRIEIRELYSNLDRRDFRWIDFVMALLVAIWVVGAGSLANDNLSNGALVVNELLLSLTAACLVCFVAFAPLAPPEVEAEPTPEVALSKYSKSALTTEHAQKLAARIERAMESEALYLDPNLSLRKLSDKVGALPNQVSQTLNQEVELSFFEYVAQHRVKASKPLVLEGNESILSVALQVGFNSKSTFYKAFKRETGMTPSDYQKSRAV